MTNLPHGVRCTYRYLQRVTTYCGVSQKEKTTYCGMQNIYVYFGVKHMISYNHIIYEMGFENPRKNVKQLSISYKTK